MEAEPRYDVLIIGAGPAGCTAAVYAARAGLHTAMLSPAELSGMASQAPWVGNFPTQVTPLPGKEVVASIRQQALEAGAEHLLEPVMAVDFSPRRPLSVFTSVNTYTAGAVIVATGAMAPADKVPGEAELLGRGVAYCSACDGPLFQGEPLLVVGHDEEAAQEALALAGTASSVCLVTPTPKLKAGEELEAALRAAKVDIECGLSLERIEGEEAVTGATFRDREGNNRTLEATGIFLYLKGSAPATGFLEGALPTDERGYLLTDELGQTGMPGVFAAGDVRSKEVRQMVIAAAEGAIAALAAERLLRGGDRIRWDRGGAPAARRSGSSEQVPAGDDDEKPE
jgi:thioredoxin reductase (NADPH)